MSDLTELAEKYAKQLAAVGYSQRAFDLVKANFEREKRELDVTAEQLKNMLEPKRPQLLVPIGFRRHVLVHTNNGSFGPYASIDIIEEERF